MMKCCWAALSVWNAGSIVNGAAVVRCPRRCRCWQFTLVAVHCSYIVPSLAGYQEAGTNVPFLCYLQPTDSPVVIVA
jgi:hypothetical protein